MKSKLFNERYDIPESEFIFNHIFPNSEFEFDKRYRYKNVTITANNYLDFPKHEGKNFWEHFDEKWIEDLKNNKLKIILDDSHEFEFFYLEKLYKDWNNIPEWLVGNMIWMTGNTDGNNIVKDLSKKYNKPMIDHVWSHDLLMGYASLGYEFGKRNYFNLHWEDSTRLNNEQVFERLKKTSLNEDRKKKFTFLTRRPREPRILMLSLLNNFDFIKDGYVSCPLEFDDSHIKKRNTWEENNHILKYCKPGSDDHHYRLFGADMLKWINSGINDMIDNNKLPLIRDTQKFDDWGKTDNLEMMWENFTDSYVHLVFETGYLYGEQNENTLPITEKTWKAVIGGQLFLPYGGYGSNSWDKLTALGFKKFRGINYDYDKVYRLNEDHPYIKDKDHINWLCHNHPDDPNSDYHLQFRLYWKEVHRLLNMSNEELKQLWLDNKDIIEHNLYNITHLEYPKDWVCKYVSVK
tara:strand:- start:1328 stop:2716 length:1389 start_codon:yes stop_codon:yes gene_type:complete